MALTPIILAPPPSPTRNNFTGCLGYRFIASRNITVTYVGRFAGSINSQNHIVNIWRALDASKIASVTITPSHPQQNGYAYAACSSVVLNSGEEYRIVSDENNAGDNWQDNTGITDGVTYTSADINSVRVSFSVTQNTYPTLGGSTTDRAYLVPNLYEGSLYSIHHRRRSTQKIIQGAF